MPDNQNEPDSNSSKTLSSTFLGGGPKFNQAGLNTPMPGEKIADAPRPPALGGPRIWIGAIIVIVLIAVLWFTVGGGLGGVNHVGGHGGISQDQRPSAYSDAPTAPTGQ